MNTLWRLKEFEEEEDEDIHMVVAGFIFNASRISKEKRQNTFFGEANTE